MIVLKDGVRFLPHKYSKEADLERLAVEHHRTIFSEDSIHFPKKKIKSLSGVGGIPDGFVVSLDHRKWWVLEFELRKHSLYNHVIPQISKFRKAYQGSRSELIKAFYDDVRGDPQKRLLFETRRIGEIHKTLSDIVESTPTVIVITDEKTLEAEEAVENLPFNTSILEFRTYCREDVGLGSHIHVFESVKLGPVSEPLDKKKKWPESEVVDTREDIERKLNEGNPPDHYFQISKAIFKPGTLPFLIRSTIRERRQLTRKDLHRVVKENGYAPKGGQVGATLVFLERITGEVRREGRGDGTRILWIGKDR